MSQYDELNEDEIIRDWTLSLDDEKFVSKFNANYRLLIYLQLCALRLFGQLIENPNTLSSQIIAYACRRLDLPLVATVSVPDRDATRTEQKRMLFEYLGFSKFSDSKKAFKSWIADRIAQGFITCEQLYHDAEVFLVQNKISLPTPYALKREINSLCHQHQEAIFNQVYHQLEEPLMQIIAALLEISEGESVSWFQRFKEYPGAATISSLKEYLNRYQVLSGIEIPANCLSLIPPKFSHHLYQLAKYYSADAMKRFNSPKRYTLMIAFLNESRKILIDYLIQMHDQYISSIYRECKNIHDADLKNFKRKNEKAIDKIEHFVDHILQQELTTVFKLEDLYKVTISRDELQQARDDMHEYKILCRHGFAKLLQNRYNSMRRYFAEFIQLPFLVEQGSQAIQQAVDLIRQLDNQRIKALPDTTPTGFVDRHLAKSMLNGDGSVKRNLWEIGVALALRDGFRSGDVFVSHSNKYVSFWNLVYADSEWKSERSIAYQKLGIEPDAELAVANISKRFHTGVSTASKRFEQDPFAEIKNGKLTLKKKDKIETPEDVKRLQTLINSYLPKIKIELLLIEVDQMTGFTQHITPIHGRNYQLKNYYKTLISSILSQATNIGTSTMQDCVPDVTADMMHNLSDSHLREETIKAANAVLVNQHSQLALSQVHGDGQLSSSDGQRFIIRANSLLASYYPRYCGYYDKAIGVYTHTSDQFSVYSTHAISCAPRESLYVIDGLLDNNTVLSIKEHTTDTEGYTEHMFALCFLLGIQFMPRIKDLKKQQLYHIDKGSSYGAFDALLNKTISLNAISDQWDQMIRTAASLKNKLCPAHEVVQRLLKGSPSDKLSKAFTQLGRLLKTEYILNYLTDSVLRDKVQRQLNKGEHRHALARWIFFANQGRFNVGDYEEIMNKASCLSLVSNAVLYWNTVKMSEIIEQLRANGESISDKTLSHISLLPHRHVVPMGTYFADEMILPEREMVEVV